MSPFHSSAVDYFVSFGNYIFNGEPVSQIMSPVVAKEVGEIMAILHLHALDYHSSDCSRHLLDYEVPNYDRNYFFGSNSWWQTKAQERLPNDYMDMIPAMEKAQHLIENLSKSSAYFGMIHSDIHFSNIICDGEKYAVIDFGDCAMGYYLMDIAVTEMEFQDYSNADRLISAFRESYKYKRGCFFSDEDANTFKVMSSLLLLEWIFESKSEQVREDKSMWLKAIVRTIRETV